MDSVVFQVHWGNRWLVLGLRWSHVTSSSAQYPVFLLCDSFNGCCELVRWADGAAMFTLSWSGCSKAKVNVKGKVFLSRDFKQREISEVLIKNNGLCHPDAALMFLHHPIERDEVLSVSCIGCTAPTGQGERQLASQWVLNVLMGIFYMATITALLSRRMGLP